MVNQMMYDATHKGKSTTKQFLAHKLLHGKEEDELVEIHQECVRLVWFCQNHKRNPLFAELLEVLLAQPVYSHMARVERICPAMD